MTPLPIIAEDGVPMCGGARCAAFREKTRANGQARWRQLFECELTGHDERGEICRPAVRQMAYEIAHDLTKRIAELEAGLAAALGACTLEDVRARLGMR